MGWLFALVVFFLQVIQVAATNYTIDDQNGNSLTGELPSYAPSNRWSQGAQCSACFAQPDSEFTFDHTWHDTTFFPTDSVEMNITMTFPGTAIYTYFILDNNTTYITFTNLTFSIDGDQVGTFSHNPDGSATYVYDALVYMNTSIPNGDHTFIIHVPHGTIPSLALFDYVQFTYDPDSSSISGSANPPSTISGPPPTISGSAGQPPTISGSASPPSKRNVGTAVAAAICALLVIGAIIFLCWRNWNRSNNVKYLHTDAFLTGGNYPETSSRGMNISNTNGLSWPPSLSTIRPYLHTNVVKSMQRSSPEQRTPSVIPPDLAARWAIPQSSKERFVLPENRRASAHPLTSSDPVLENQMEVLRQEVAMLREVFTTRGGGEAPPQYQD